MCEYEVFQCRENACALKTNSFVSCQNAVRLPLENENELADKQSFMCQLCASIHEHTGKVETAVQDICM